MVERVFYILGVEQQGAGERDCGAQQHRQHVRLLPCFDEALRRIFFRLGLLHHSHDALERRVARRARHSHQHAAAAVHRAGENGRFGRFVNRCAFAGNRRFVNPCFPLDHLAVDRHAFAGRNRTTSPISSVAIPTRISSPSRTRLASLGRNCISDSIERLVR